MVSFLDFAGRLARGQLKNTSAVEDTNLGEISPDYIDTILDHTNQGLIDISTRMPLIKKNIDLVFVADQNIYTLADGAGYLDDSDSLAEPFVEDDFIKVLDIFDANGLRHTTNTDGHIMQPTYKTLRFTTAKITELTRDGATKVRIRWQSKHAEIVEADDIDIPPNLVIALQLFVASLYISSMNGKEHSAQGDRYLGTYLGMMGEDVARDLSSTSEVDVDTRFEDRGFV